MSDYTYQDLVRMQEEAKARVLEMRRRSRFAAEDFDGEEARAESGERRAEMRQEPGKPRRNESPPDRAKAIRMPVELPPEKPQQTETGRGYGGGAEASPTAERTNDLGVKNAARGSVSLSAALHDWFGSLGEEETEKMFILALCLLLSQENGDEGLLLSLMYLLT